MAGNLSVQKTLRPQVFNSTRRNFIRVGLGLLGGTTAKGIHNILNPSEAKATGLKDPQKVAILDNRVAQGWGFRINVSERIRFDNNTVLKINARVIFKSEEYYQVGNHWYMHDSEGYFIPAQRHESWGRVSFTVQDRNNRNNRIRFRIVEEPRRVEQPTLRKVTPNAKNLYDHITVGTTILGLYTPDRRSVYKYLVTHKGTSTDGKYTVLTINYINPDSGELGHDEYIAVEKRTGQIFKNESGNENYNRTLAENWNRDGFLLNP